MENFEFFVDAINTTKSSPNLSFIVRKIIFRSFRSYWFLSYNLKTSGKILGYILTI